MSPRISIPPHYAQRMHILAAADELLDNVSFEDLTVKAICEKANTTRQTFYRYFIDKYEIAQWHFSLIAEEGVFEIGRTTNWQGGYLITMGRQYELKDFYHHVSSSRGYNSIAQYVERARIANLKETVTECLKEELDEELQFQIAATAILESTLITRWMRDRMPESPQELASFMMSSVPRRLYDMLNVDSAPQRETPGHTDPRNSDVQKQRTQFDVH